jgi:hypothetical protein
MLAQPEFNPKQMGGETAAAAVLAKGPPEEAGRGATPPTVEGTTLGYTEILSIMGNASNRN